LLGAGGEAVGFFVCRRGDDGDAGHDVRLGERFGGLELRTVKADGLVKKLRGEVTGKGEGQAEFGSELGTEGAGAEEPDGDACAGAGEGGDVLAGRGGGEVVEKLIEKFGRSSPVWRRVRRMAREVRPSEPGARPIPRSMRPG